MAWNKVTVFAWVSVFSGAAFLAGAAQAASCFSGSNIVDPAKINADKEAIKSDPTHWFPGRGGNLARSVRDVAASDPDFAKTIVSQAHVSATGGGGKEQSSAVGAGLGQAATVCQSRPEEAIKIQSAAAESPDPFLVASYSSTTGNTQTAATGGGGDAAGGSTGNGGTAGANPVSQTTGSGGAVTTPASTGVTNNFQSLLTFSSPGSPSSITAAADVNGATVNP